MWYVVMCGIVCLLFCSVWMWCLEEVVCYCDMFSVVVNAMLSLMSVMSPPPALCNLSLHTVVKCGVMYFGCVDFRGELGFLNCYDICMRVVNKQFELLEFVLSQFMLTCIMLRFLSLLLPGWCVCSPWSSVRLTWYPML